MATDPGNRTVTAVIALLLVATVGAGPALAQEEATGDEGGPIDVSGWTAVLALLVGTVILMASIELLVHALVRTAVRLGVSVFLLAVVFSGWEFDNVVVGAFTGFREMQNVAFGLAIGNAISIFGLTLALGALLFPFVVDFPRDYLLLTVTAPFLLLPVILSGTLTPAHGVVFVSLYVVVFAYIVRRERRAGRTFMQSDEVREATTPADGGADASRGLPEPVRELARNDWFWPLMLVVAVGGIVVGGTGSAAGVEGILETWNLTGTFVGVTILTILYTLDDVLLIVEPLRLGYQDVAVGGVVGSLLFFVTANVGIIALVGDIHFRPETVFFHLPVLFAFAGLSSYLLWRGRLARRHGALLLGLYLLYTLINVYLFSVPPVAE